MLDLGEQAAAFLTMVSETKGHFVAHPTSIDRLQTHIACDYYEITKADTWTMRKLFSFRIPTALLMGTAGERLYESFLPLVPRVADTAIYYNDGDQDTHIYRYDIGTGATKPLARQAGETFFAPLRVQAMVFYGGSLLAEDRGPEILCRLSGLTRMVTSVQIYRVWWICRRERFRSPGTPYFINIIAIIGDVDISDVGLITTLPGLAMAKHVYNCGASSLSLFERIGPQRSCYHSCVEKLTTIIGINLSSFRSWRLRANCAYQGADKAHGSLRSRESRNKEMCT